MRFFMHILIHNLVKLINQNMIICIYMLLYYIFLDIFGRIELLFMNIF